MLQIFSLSKNPRISQSLMTVKSMRLLVESSAPLKNFTYLSPVCLRSWSFWLPFVLKLCPQLKEHWYGFSSLCILAWDFRFDLSVNDRPQPGTVHRKAKMPLWMFMWVRMRVFRVKLLLQPGYWHAKGFLSCSSPHESLLASDSIEMFLILLF